MRINQTKVPVFRVAKPLLARVVKSVPISLGEDLACFFSLSSAEGFRAEVLQVLRAEVAISGTHLRNLSREILGLPQFRESDIFSRRMLIQFRSQKRRFIEIIVPNVLYQEADFIKSDAFNFRELLQGGERNLELARVRCLRLNFLFLVAIAKTLCSRSLALELCTEFEPLGESEAALLQTVEVACRGIAKEIYENPNADFLGIFPELRGEFLKPELPPEYGIFGYLRHYAKLGIWKLRQFLK